MICVTIHDCGLDRIEEILGRPEVRMAEIRLDSCPLDEEEIANLFSCSDKPLVATLRDRYDEEAERSLALAVASGAAYIDLDIETPPAMGKRLRRAAQENGTVVIRSFHDMHGTPTLEELKEIAQTCRRFGGEVIKVVTRSDSPGDWETLKSLYDTESRLIAFCANEPATRLEALSLGAPFVYAAPSAGDEAVPGQPPVEELFRKVYGEWRHRDIQEEVELPSSKSFAQRAIIAAALASGTSHLSGYTPCTDSVAAIEAARSLGAEVTEVDGTLIINGIGPCVRTDTDEVNAGESGLLARLLIPLMAAIGPGRVSIKGEGTLLGRPLSDANDIMAPFGVVLTGEGNPRGRKDVYLPVEVVGHLLPGKAEISGQAGSQLISGLLMALPLLEKGSMVYVQEPRSIPYMFITLDVLRRFGISISNEMEGDEEFLQTRDWAHCTATSFKMRGGQSLHAADIDLERDWSAAANILVAGALFGSASVAGLDTGSLQADINIVDILVDAGAMASEDEGGRINVSRAPLTAIEVDLSNSPDLFPIVAVLAAFCDGTSRLTGTGRLIHKESNRAQAIVLTLNQLGVPASIEGDTLLVGGMTLERRLLGGSLLKGGHFTSFHDHRMVMALTVASLGASSPVIIDDVKCVAKSWPGFGKFAGAPGAMV